MKIYTGRRFVSEAEILVVSVHWQCLGSWQIGQVRPDDEWQWVVYASFAQVALLEQGWELFGRVVSHGESAAIRLHLDGHVSREDGH